MPGHGVFHIFGKPVILSVPWPQPIVEPGGILCQGTACFIFLANRLSCRCRAPTGSFIFWFSLNYELRINQNPHQNPHQQLQISGIAIPLSPVPCHLSPVTCPLSPVTCPLSPFPCHLSPIPYPLNR